MRFLTRHLQILRSSVLVVSLSILSISVTNFMSDLKRALVIELFWTQSRCHGGFGALSPQTKLPAPQIQIWNIINQWSFCHFQNVKSRCTNVKPLYWRLAGPFIETFIRAFRVTSNSRFPCLVSNGTELKIPAQASLWQVEWNGQHNAAIWLSRRPLAQHGLCFTSETMQLLKCFEMSKINSVTAT